MIEQNRAAGSGGPSRGNQPLSLMTKVTSMPSYLRSIATSYDPILAKLVGGGGSARFHCARNCDRSSGLVMVACIGGIDLADYGKFDGPGRREAPAGCDNAATSSTTALANWMRCIATRGRHPPRILFAAGFVGLRHQANWYASLSYRRRERRGGRASIYIWGRYPQPIHP
jgi:hypothetical protein